MRHVLRYDVTGAVAVAAAAAAYCVAQRPHTPPPTETQDIAICCQPARVRAVVYFIGNRRIESE